MGEGHHTRCTLVFPRNIHFQVTGISWKNPVSDNMVTKNHPVKVCSSTALKDPVLGNNVTEIHPVKLCSGVSLKDPVSVNFGIYLQDPVSVISGIYLQDIGSGNMVTDKVKSHCLF